MPGRSPSTVNRPPSYWIRSGLLTLMEKGCGLVFAFGTAALLLRMLSREDFAAWGIFLLATYFIEMGRSGLIQNGLVRHLSLSRGKGDVYAAVSTASLALNFGFSLASNVLLWFSTAWLAGTWQVPQIEKVLPLYCATNIVMTLFSHFNCVQQANFEFRGIFWSTFFYRGALFAWIAGCFLLNFPLELRHLALALLAGTVLGALASGLFARPYLSVSRSIDFQWIKKLGSYGKYVLGTNLSTMLYKNVDKLALGHLIGPAAFALYDAAGKVTQMVEAPSFSIAQVVFPQGAVRMERDGPDGVKRLYEKSVAATLAIILPVIALIFFFAGPVIRIFAGDQYAESAGLLRLTAFFGLFLPFAVQFGTLLDATGRPAVNFVMTLFTALLNLILSYGFVLYFGLFGAAFATLATYVISFAIMQVYLYNKFKISVLNVFGYLPGLYRQGWDMLMEIPVARQGTKRQSGKTVQPNNPATMEQ